MKKEKFKILLIEDEEFLGDLLVKKLKTEGHTIEWVKDGKNGLERTKDGEYDLILLDMILPDLNGYSILDSLREEGNEIPIIIISNSGQPVDIQEAREKGAMDYLVKSDFGPKDVIRKIYENLSLKDEYSSGETEGGLILLIEDDRFLRELMIKKLENHDYNVITAINGEEGLKSVRDNKPNLVLLDIIMPGLNGFQVLEKIRNDANKEISDVPVIMLTNLGEDNNNQKAEEMGASDYILKANFDTEDILKKVNYYIKEGE